MTNFAHHSFATRPCEIRVLRTNATLMVIVVALLAVVATPLISAQTFIFNRADFATGTGPSVLAVGDFNGDGLMDVVTGNDDTANTVSVLLGNGNGTFATHVDYPVGGAVAGIAVGDFNNDGKLDIVVVYGFDPAKVAVLLGNGDGTFKPFTPTTAGFQGGSIAVGDFNGDGKLDVAVSDNESTIPGVDIMLGNGNGTFEPPVGYATAPDPRMVIAGDFNSDGKVDLATTNAESETISVLLGNGDGTFQTHKDNSTAIAASCISLAAGALSDNRRLDIVAGCQAEGEVVVLISNGNGTFKAAKAYPVPAGVDDVALGDFNGDGKLDVAVTNAGTMVSILPGTGSGTLKAAVPFGTNYGPSGIASADFNGDGKVDLVTADDGAPFGATVATISVLLSNGKDMFAARTDYSVGNENVTGAYSGIAAADLTGNGKPDLIVPITFAYPYEISILMNKGNGTFKPFVSYPLPTGAVAVVAGDFNNDHKPDIAVANGNGTGVITVLLNSGTGTFPTYTQYSINGISDGLAVGDFNKDGNLDIVATNGSQNTISVLLGNGTGTFPTFATYTTGSSPYGVTVGDFNGDGWPDIAVANRSSGTVSILINKADGSGTFLPKVDYAAAGGGAPLTLAAGSFRGNGKIDLAVATDSAFGGIEVLLGNGDGTFQKAVPYDTLNNANGVVVGDFNNDGNLDLAVSIASADSAFGFVTILPGLGNGTFGPGITLTSAPLPYGIVAADFNGDGGLDLAMGNGTTGGDTGSATVLLNEPLIGLTPDSLTFAARKVGTTSAAQVVTVSNPGATPLKVTSITITGDFAETNDCPAKLTVGKSCTINVTFSPTATGTRTGTLSIKDSALSSVQGIALTGSGT
jgi:FG-GAP-like repeat/Abnormal spindle-like microcephaly-assoc'd, ASPM-SPD-2-Hydin/FG-GAP repeat